MRYDDTYIAGMKLEAKLWDFYGETKLDKLFFILRNLPSETYQFMVTMQVVKALLKIKYMKGESKMQADYILVI